MVALHIGRRIKVSQEKLLSEAQNSVAADYRRFVQWPHNLSKEDDQVLKDDTLDFLLLCNIYVTDYGIRVIRPLHGKKPSDGANIHIFPQSGASIDQVDLESRMYANDTVEARVVSSVKSTSHRIQIRMTGYSEDICASDMTFCESYVIHYLPYS